MTARQWVIEKDSTFNPETGTFVCDSCFLQTRKLT